MILAEENLNLSSSALFVLINPSMCLRVHLYVRGYHSSLPKEPTYDRRPDWISRFLRTRVYVGQRFSKAMIGEMVQVDEAELIQEMRRRYVQQLVRDVMAR